MNTYWKNFVEGALLAQAMLWMIGAGVMSFALLAYWVVDALVTENAQPHSTWAWIALSALAATTFCLNLILATYCRMTVVGTSRFDGGK